MQEVLNIWTSVSKIKLTFFVSYLSVTYFQFRFFPSCLLIAWLDENGSNFRLLTCVEEEPLNIQLNANELCRSTKRLVVETAFTADFCCWWRVPFLLLSSYVTSIWVPSLTSWYQTHQGNFTKSLEHSLHRLKYPLGSSLCRHLPFLHVYLDVTLCQACGQSSRFKKVQWGAAVCISLLTVSYIKGSHDCI